MLLSVIFLREKLNGDFLRFASHLEPLVLDFGNQSISNFTAHVPTTFFDPERDLVVCCERRTNHDTVL